MEKEIFELSNAGSSKRVVVKYVSNQITFYAMAKSNIAMTENMIQVANRILDVLYDTWSTKYDTMSGIDDDVIFRKMSLEEVRNIASKAVKIGLVDPQKEKISITAMCIFEEKDKAFWINTGADNVYCYEGKRLLFKLSDMQKKLNKFRYQSVFNDNADYEEMAEGGVIDTPVSMIMVSKDAQVYFEMMRGFCTKETFDAFALGRGSKNPLIITEIYS